MLSPSHCSYYLGSARGPIIKLPAMKFSLPDTIKKPKLPKRSGKSLPTDWIGKHVWTILWVAQSTGLFLAFVGICGVSSYEAAIFKGWLWWTLVLHVTVTAVGMYLHFRPDTHVPGGPCPKLLVAALSGVTLTIACDRAAVASGTPVCF